MKRSFITIEAVRSHLAELGINSGDVIFIAADIMRLGYFNGNRQKTLDDIVGVLISLVGSEGTLVIPAYTDTFYKFRKKPEIVFNESVNSNSGNLANHLLNYTGALRSKHPTNSLVAIGRQAEFILSDHDEKSLSYTPLFKIIELGGKNLMLACFDKFSLAPMALHAAQEKLGYSVNHWQSGLIQSYYFKNGKKLLFTRMDIGGCVSGSHKFLGYHFMMDAIKILKFGSVTSALIDTNKSYDIFVSILKKNPEILKCDDTSCHDCYGSKIYNPRKFVYHWLCFIFRKIVYLSRLSR